MSGYLVQEPGELAVWVPPTGTGDVIATAIEAQLVKGAKKLGKLALDTAAQETKKLFAHGPNKADKVFFKRGMRPQATKVTQTNKNNNKQNRKQQRVASRQRVMTKRKGNGALVPYGQNMLGGNQIGISRSIQVGPGGSPPKGHWGSDLFLDQLDGSINFETDGFEVNPGLGYRNQGPGS